MSRKRIKGILPVRKSDSHKGDYGHVFILAGSVGLTGAAYLASRASLLSGSGLVTLGLPKSLNSIMEVKLTEVMTKPLAETVNSTLSLGALPQIKKILPAIDALAVGPGLSRNPQTQKLVHKLLSTVTKPLVLDADGINALIGKLTVFSKIKAKVVLTPHPGEISRLLNLSIAEIQKNRSKIAKEFAQKYNLVLVLKGHRTVVASGKGQIYVNETGNPGMASGGCGDVLTGMIASFLGQGISPYLAAKLAVYVHGLAGDYAAKEKGQISLTAGDVLDKLPQALKAAF
ncbi:MAG: NAD(P)H-hydrate dehydratase [Candidatus Omnitrophica bacterium]|nr:NAD(P)H-hydrate dehydratase [Candidatus Omnitrophota bacterium]